MDENEEIENVMRSLSDVVGEKVNFDDGDIRVVGRSALINPANRGRFYFFFYRPATARELPYYTLFPAVVNLNVEKETFIGANLLYVAEQTRPAIIQFFQRYQTTKIGFPRSFFNYDIVKKFRLFRALLTPTIKQYRLNRISSRIIELSPSAYTKFFTGPMGEALQRGFVKRGIKTIHFESRLKILNALLNK